jgi:hypothetical protein
VVHSVTFGCDLLRGIGQSSGRISAPYTPLSCLTQNRVDEEWNRVSDSRAMSSVWRMPSNCPRNRFGSRPRPKRKSNTTLPPGRLYCHRKRWTPVEDAKVTPESPTDRQLSRPLGRSVQAIQQRRALLRDRASRAN